MAVHGFDPPMGWLVGKPTDDPGKALRGGTGGGGDTCPGQEFLRPWPGLPSITKNTAVLYLVWQGLVKFFLSVRSQDKFYLIHNSHQVVNDKENKSELNDKM